MDLLRLAAIAVCLGLVFSSVEDRQSKFSWAKPNQFRTPTSGRFFQNLFMPWGYLSMVIPTSTRTVFTVSLTTVLNTVDAYCIDGKPLTEYQVCPLRRRRGLFESDDDAADLFIDGQPFRPSQVARMLIVPTETPHGHSLQDAEHWASLSASMRSDGDEPQGRNFNRQNTKWYYATTVTSTLTAISMVNITSPPTSIAIGGSCIPDCLTTLPFC